MVDHEVVAGLDFDPETDFEESPAWFLDGTHSVPPWTPMFGWFWVNFCRHGMQYGAEKLGLPTVRGWDWRFRNGGGYLTLLLVKSKDEREAREARFRQAIRPFVTDYDGLWQGCVDEMLGRYEALKRLDFARASNSDVLENFEETVAACRRMWELHMYMMYGTYTAYILFENVCREVVGIDDTVPLFHRLMSGFDNKVLQVDRRLWAFSKRAEELGLGALFLGTAAEGLRDALAADAAGRTFLAEFREFLDEDGWRMQRMSEINLPTWIEDPAPALQNVKQFLSRGGDFNLDQERARATQEREDAERQVLAKVKPEQRGWFTTLLRVAQKGGVFSEEHDHYFDLYTHAMIRRVCLELGRRLAAAGTVDQVDDIFFLVPEDVRRAALNPECFRLQGVVASRRAQWQSWCKAGNPPVLLREGVDMEQAMRMLVRSNDPIALKVVVGTVPVVRPEFKADLQGTCGSPGVAEGTARIVLTESQLSDVRPGDILVAASTSPSWTPVFSFIAGVVVDRGGSLSHAAIVGREYGIPVLMNVFDGTQKIKDGQRIRVDANLGVLYLLDK